VRSEQTDAKRSLQAELQDLRTEHIDAKRQLNERLTKIRSRQQDARQHLEDQQKAVAETHRSLQDRLDAIVEEVHGREQELASTLTETVNELIADQKATREELVKAVAELAASGGSASGNGRLKAQRNRRLHLLRGDSITVFPDDVFLTSYPRSGNTWFRFLLSNLRYWHPPTNFDNVEERIPDIYVVPDEGLALFPRARILKSHEPRPSAQRLEQKVVYITRDPCSVAASSFAFRKHAGEISRETTPEEFTSMFLDGALPFGSWEDHVNGWLTGCDESQLLLVRYEDAERDPVPVLRRVADFVGIPADDRTLARAVDLSDFGRMRELDADYRSRGGVNSTLIGASGAPPAPARITQREVGRNDAGSRLCLTVAQRTQSAPRRRGRWSQMARR
jgi:hypothetical protein